jgi:hypothetical protein
MATNKMSDRAVPRLSPSSAEVTAASQPADRRTSA